MNLLLEVCAGSLSSSLNAQTGGAHRIELCDNLSEGGTTPSPGIIRQAVKILKIPVFVLIRPRAGDFLYSDAEFDAMKEDILFCKEHRAKGIVTGVLKSDGTVDLQRTEELVRLAKPMQVTFHRAFDMVRDPFQSMENIIKLGIDRILTSGQADKAADGARLIRELIIQSASRIIIMPGGGINEENILLLEQTTKAVEYHASLRSPVKSRMLYHSTKSFMGDSTLDEYSWMETDADRVGRFIGRLNSFSKKIIEND
jgi:copper homeostasis protein